MQMKRRRKRKRKQKQFTRLVTRKKGDCCWTTSFMHRRQELTHVGGRRSDTDRFSRRLRTVSYLGLASNLMTPILLLDVNPVDTKSEERQVALLVRSSSPRPLQGTRVLPGPHSSYLSPQSLEPKVSLPHYTSRQDSEAVCIQVEVVKASRPI